MSANWNLGEQFLGGASLAARIAGQLKQQDFDSRRLDDEESSNVADSVARTGYTPDQLGDPDSGAGKAIQDRNTAAATGKLKLEDAQADYYSGRNAAYSGAAQARAAAQAAAAGQKGIASLQNELKQYDQMAMIDPDGSKGIYTSDKANYHAALWNRFSTMQGIATPPAPGDGDTAGSGKPGFWSGIGQGVGAMMTVPMGGLSGLSNYFGGSAASPPAPAAPAAAPAARVPAYTKFSSGGGKRYGLNPQTNAWDLLAGGR